MRVVLKLTILTGQRLGTIVGLRLDELKGFGDDVGGGEPRIVIPGTHTVAGNLVEGRMKSAWGDFDRARIDIEFWRLVERPVE